MKFDPDSEYAKHRDASGGVWLIQNGRKYTVRGRDLGEKDDLVLSTEAKEKDERKQDVRDRASDKLKHFKNLSETGPIAEAFKENAEAVAAEENAP